MLDFKEIDIYDKPLFDKYLLEYKPRASEMNFTNFFMWRNFYKFKFIEISNLLCIISVPDNGEPFAFIPIGMHTPEGFRGTVFRIMDYFFENGWRPVFKRVEEEKVQLFKEYLNFACEVVFDRDSSDYVYLTEELINLKGKKFDGKRNHINKFKKLYEYEYIRMSNEHIDECIRINEEWCAQRSCDTHKELYCEKIANNELLKNFSKLGCKGALIKVNGRIEGYTIGEVLNNDTAVIHIEKASSDIRGLYTIINQQFCENEWRDMTYINREQDLGIEGLRKAKLSYNPVRMTNKYSVYMHYA
ncbi:MAG: DUF2156 domain-containing protein [Bacillota bacterium]